MALPYAGNKMVFHGSNVSEGDSSSVYEVTKPTRNYKKKYEKYLER
jgi:hypothetical protein